MRWLFVVVVCWYGSEVLSLDCPLQPILRGVSVKQDLGAGNKKIYTSEADCKTKCKDETDFPCNAILWPAGEITGDCYLFDKVDISKQLFVDQRPFILYVPVCSGDPTPAVGYCEFLLTQQSVSPLTDVPFESPGDTTETSCHEFCIASYRGKECLGYTVSSPSVARASKCTLYSQEVSNLPSGTQNLWTKSCSEPPVNCEYSQWSEWTTCSISCGGGGSRSRQRSVLTQANADGVQCLDSEKEEVRECGTQDCNSDCIYFEWSDYGTCNAACGQQGVRERTRTVVREALTGGAACKDTEKTETKECASTSECGDPCMFSTWSEWSSCSTSCQMTRMRTLLMGNPTNCEIEHGPLTNILVCEGADCDSISATTTKPGGGQATTTKSSAVTKATTTAPANLPPMEETGCRIDRVDPSSKPSSTNYKAVGVRADCARTCSQETGFQCKAYLTKGPNTPCILFGAIDRNITVLTSSAYYIQDLDCTTKSSVSVCEWKKSKSGIAPDFGNPDNYASIGLTIDAPHCATLCMMNHPIFKPKPCVAYAWNPLIGFTSSKDNCFMYNWEAVSSSTEAGDYDFYTLVCP